MGELGFIEDAAAVAATTSLHFQRSGLDEAGVRAIGIFCPCSLLPQITARHVDP